MVKRSRDQSQEAPRRRIWRVMVEPDSSFHSHTRFEEFLAPEIVARNAFCIQLALHHDLGGDAGVVGARLPQGVLALHAVVADQGIHQGVLEGVAHVQRAGDVGRRQHDAVGRPCRLAVVALK